MGKLSLWQEGKSKDYIFLDNVVKQQFQVGGTAIYVHKYLGTYFQGNTGDKTQDGPNEQSEMHIQDVLLLENRDRKYDKDIIELRGVYPIADLEFNLSQFGIFLSGDTLFISFHINEMVECLGRKLMAGDVLELVHKRDDLLLDIEAPAINAFYVVKEATRSAEGYSATWLPHIWRVKAEPITDAQEYKDVLNKELNQGKSIKDILSNYNKTITNTETNQEQAQDEVDRRNYDSQHFFIKSGSQLPGDNLLPWTFNGDGIPPNGNEKVNAGTRFPSNPMNGDYFLRTDYEPERLFRRGDTGWIAIEDNWRRDYVPAHRVLDDFLNEDKQTVVGPYPEDSFPERQALSKTVLPKVKIPTPDENIQNDQDLDENI